MHLQEIRFVYFISYHCLPTYRVEQHQRTPPYPDNKTFALGSILRKISLIFCHILSRSIMFSYLFTYCQRSYFVIKHLFKFIQKLKRENRWYPLCNTLAFQTMPELFVYIKHLFWRALNFQFLMYPTPERYFRDINVHDDSYPHILYNQLKASGKLFDSCIFGIEAKNEVWSLNVKQY